MKKNTEQVYFNTTKFHPLGKFSKHITNLKILITEDYNSSKCVPLSSRLVLNHLTNSTQGYVKSACMTNARIYQIMKIT